MNTGSTTTRFAIGAATALALASPSAAQAFQTPGQPSYGYTSIEDSQSTRFSSEFNPAFSFVVDGLGEYDHFSGQSSDGFDLNLRILELGAQAWIDPKAWGYFIGATDGDLVAIEEAAIHYVGFEENSVIRAGRFFIDFGKQMQIHVHELRTVERPLVLRAYLGDEVKGDGVQWDDWRPIGDKTVARVSIAAFKGVFPEEDPFAPDFERSVEDVKDFHDLNFTGRLTGFTELSDSGTLQIGTSARVIPEFAVEFAATGDTAIGLDNTVYGFDATYGWVDETAQRRWTFGGEYLLNTGDVSADNSVAGTVTPIDENLSGYFAFADYAWSRFDSAGVQYSGAELFAPDPNVPGGVLESDAGEVELYWSHQFSEFHRLRFAVSSMSIDNGEDLARFMVQYTAVLGAHGHGINW